MFLWKNVSKQNRFLPQPRYFITVKSAKDILTLFSYSYNFTQKSFLPQSLIEFYIYFSYTVKINFKIISLYVLLIFYANIQNVSLEDFCHEGLTGEMVAQISPV